MLSWGRVLGAPASVTAGVSASTMRRPPKNIAKLIAEALQSTCRNLLTFPPQGQVFARFILGRS